jgi:hypothetical protein
MILKKDVGKIKCEGVYWTEPAKNRRNYRLSLIRRLAVEFY